MQHNRDEGQADGGMCSFTPVRSGREYIKNRFTIRKEKKNGDKRYKMLTLTFETSLTASKRHHLLLPTSRLNIDLVTINDIRR
jgi:hypothetical protein